MKRLSIVLTFLSMVVGPRVHTMAGDLRVGAASVKITPPEGTPMAGYYFARAATGVHDDLHAKAIVLELDGERAAIVALDLITTTRGVVERARSEIEKETGIKGSSVTISATHAHTGPVLSDRSPRAESLGGESDLSARYTASLPGLIARSVREARERLRPATAGVAVGREETLSFCRRFWMADGTVGWNPGKLNPRIVRPVGPIDPSVPVVCFEGSDRNPIATYVNFAMHLDTVGGLEISADYPYTLAKALAEVQGPDMVTIFTIGTAGDLNHIDVGWAGPQKGHREAARIGTVLAGEVVRCLPRLETIAQPRALRSQHAIVRFPARPQEPGSAEKARAAIARKDPAPTFLETVEAYRVLDVEARGGKPYEAEVHAIALDDALAWVSLPGEVFVELGLAIKAASPFRTTIVAELANGSVGYIPTRRAFGEGNYEVVSSRVAEGSGELLVDAALGILRELHSLAIAR